MIDITALLNDARDSKPGAAERVFGMLYDDLRRVARSKLRQHGDAGLMETSELVHEAFVRLQAAAPNQGFPDRGHFLSYAARVMRSVVVDLIRSRMAERHGGDVVHTAFDTEAVDRATRHDDEALRVDEGLQELAAVDARLAQVVELRYFAG